MNANQAIGVFDSGIGGLSVVKQLIHTIPHENIVYLGDIARIPYGTKSVATIRKFTAQMVEHLLSHNVKAVIIACNTISANARDTVTNLVGNNVPVLDVISAACSIAYNYNKVGVIATPATINSKAYADKLLQLNSQLEIHSQACSLFVPLIEEGFIDHPALELIAKEYLAPLNQVELDALILGCTHYPLIQTTIAKIMGSSVKIIDPAIPIIDQLITVLQSRNLLNPSTKPGLREFYITDIPTKFKTIGETFLHHKIENINLVNLEN